MFADRTATAMIPATDLARARAWYRDKLGLEPAEDMGEMGVAYELGGTRAFLYPTRYAGTAEHTILSFDSPDLVADTLRRSTDPKRLYSILTQRFGPVIIGLNLLALGAAASRFRRGTVRGLEAWAFVAVTASCHADP